MKVYLAGPMRGLPNWNLEAFDEAEKRWKEAGWHVFNPAALVRSMGYQLDGACQPGTHEINSHLRHVMLSDVGCIMHSDAIALLPNWEHSAGVTVELALAHFLGLKVYNATNMIEMFVMSRPWSRCSDSREQELIALGYRDGAKDILNKLRRQAVNCGQYSTCALVRE